MVVSVRRHQHTHLPRRRSGHTTTVTIGAERFCLTANQQYDGSLGEVFIHWGKHGTSAAGLVNAYAVALSLGLQHQVPLAELIRPGLDQFFVPNGHTDDPEIPRVRSAVDYIARRLAIDWLAYAERAELGVYTLTERVHRARTWLTRELAPGRQRLQYFPQSASRARLSRPELHVHGDVQGPGMDGQPEPAAVVAAVVDRAGRGVHGRAAVARVGDRDAGQVAQGVRDGDREVPDDDTASRAAARGPELLRDLRRLVVHAS